MLDILKKLSKAIKILMLISAGIVLLFLVSIFAKIFVLTIISAVVFIILAIAITLTYFWQENGTTFNENRHVKQVSAFIISHDSLHLNEIAKQFRLTIPQTRHLVFECLKSKLIEGYTINGNKVEKIELTNQAEEEVKVIHCVGCGARFTSGGSVKKCPYCGNVYK